MEKGGVVPRPQLFSNKSEMLSKSNYKVKLEVLAV